MGNQITSEEKNKEGFSSSLIREAPPCHFRFKIESFSSLSALPLERYESCEFNAGDYKWRLAFYPNGNKKGDGQNHISMCLVLDKTCNNNLNKEISVTFNFLAYDQIRDKYLSVPGVGRFHSMKSELSIDKFIPLWMFNDPSYGFLVQDSCMFGADVFVVDSAASTGQCLSMTRVKPVPLKYRWTIQKFSGLEDKCYYSDKFRIGDHDWKIALYPKGYIGNNISLYLHLVNEKTLLAAGGMVYAEFKLRVVDQVNAKHFEKSYICCSFIASQTSGSLCFLNASKLNKSTGYLVNDTCILEAEVIVVGSAKNWI